MMLRLLSELSFSPIEFQNIVFELLSTFFQLFLFLCVIFFQFIEFVMKLGTIHTKMKLLYGSSTETLKIINTITSFSASFNSASFSFTRATNICRISSSFCWSSCRWMDLFASQVCWKLTGLFSLSTSLNPIWKL